MYNGDKWVGQYILNKYGSRVLEFWFGLLLLEIGFIHNLQDQYTDKNII